MAHPLDQNPPKAFSLLPFWFWNDALDESELLRQIADFEAHGVHGFVLHPRVGLPRDCGWMSDRLLAFMGVAIEEAARRDMTVLLYDEGMYPSGSASGQVVAADPSYACRCLAVADPDVPLPDGHRIVFDGRVNGDQFRVVDRPVDACIRGLHYLGDGPDEDEPPMADILNPDAVQTFIRLVYDRYFEAFGPYFGKTVMGIFTDEPNPLGRCRESDVWPGTTGILEHVQRFLDEDFTQKLPALWNDRVPDAQHHRERYRHAIRMRLEETWYEPLHDWCNSHGVSLCGHPDQGDEIGCQRFFHIPGQDLVWRFVEPNQPTATQGPESTQAKASSSAAIHLGRSRNSNEFCGAYGPETTFDELRWLALWCIVRGVDLLIPHAFYYSVRGPRRAERPPQVGPNAPWWNDCKPFADACRRLCWLNGIGTQVCDVAILTSDRCPWRAAESLFERQIDFNYLEDRLLLHGRAEASRQDIRVGPMRYHALVLEDEALLTPELVTTLKRFEDAGRVIRWQPDTTAWVETVSRLTKLPSLWGRPVPGLRVRQLKIDGIAVLMLFNERDSPIERLPWLDVNLQADLIDLRTGCRERMSCGDLSLQAHELSLLEWATDQSSPPS